MGLLTRICFSLLLTLVLALDLQCLAIQPMTSRLTFGTTFGRPSNDHPNSKNNTAVATGKICKIEADCAYLANTSCIKSQGESIKRCLCGDRTSQKNGKCPAKPKIPGFPCTDDQECVEGAECIVANHTHPLTGVSGRQCICKLGEDDDECNGATQSRQIAWSFHIMVGISLFSVTEFH